jgi:glutathione S-transferase
MLVSLGGAPLLATSLAFFAGSFRKAAKVSYPNLYLPPQAVKESKDAYRYTCAQRSHANYMDNLPQAMISMLVAGLTYPRASAALGAGWMVSRLLFAYGYIYGA